MGHDSQSASDGEADPDVAAKAAKPLRDASPTADSAEHVDVAPVARRVVAKARDAKVVLAVAQR
jgi:hypothetical protein